MALNIIVFIVVAPGYETQLRGRLLALAAETANEVGCERFEVYVDNEHIVLLERWADQKAIDDHMEMPYTRQFLMDCGALIVETKVQKLTSMN